jgi:glycosyltransferase involved in cell wall biosynthesis
MRCVDLIREHEIQESVTMVTDYLTDEESMALLSSAALIVFPYQVTAESSSAAVRHGLATHCPVACTPLEIFSDVSDVVHFLPGVSAQEIAVGLDQLLLDPARLAEKQQLQDQWLADHSWSLLGKRLAGMIKGLWQAHA